MTFGFERLRGTSECHSQLIKYYISVQTCSPIRVILVSRSKIGKSMRMVASADEGASGSKICIAISEPVQSRDQADPNDSRTFETGY